MAFSSTKGRENMSQLMTFSEVQGRYQEREDPFDVTVEKWVRIQLFSNTASSLNDFQQLYQAANVAVPFCFEYQIKACSGCPLENVCGRGRGEKLLRVMKRIQTHVWAILAGNTLPKEPLMTEINSLITELKELKRESKERGD
jgi:hypothetical protein